MKGRVSLAKALILYGVLVGFGLVFFLSGLFISQEHLRVGEPVPGMTISPAGSIFPEPRLDFYEELTDPPSSEPIPDVKVLPEATPQAKPALNPDADPPEEAFSTPLPDPPDAAGSTERFTIQVGALSRRQEASRMLIRLEAKGYDGRLQLPEAGGDDFYRIWVGEFSDWDQARAVENQLKEDGFLTYLRKINP